MLTIGHILGCFDYVFCTCGIALCYPFMHLRSWIGILLGSCGSLVGGFFGVQVLDCYDDYEELSVT